MDKATKIMDKVTKIVKIITYLSSIILPMLDGVKGVTSKINNIYGGNEDEK